MKAKRWLTGLAAVVLTGCQSTSVGPAQQAMESSAQEAEQRTSAAAADQLNTLPSAVDEALMPQTEGSQQALFSEPLYDVNAQQVDAVSFFSSLVADTPFSAAIHPDVSGTISLHLKQVTLSDVMTLVSDLYGFDIQRSGKVYRVYPAGMRTETIAVNYLLMQRDGITQTSISSGGVSQQDGSNRQNNNRNGFNNFSGNNSNGNSIGSGQFGNTINGTNIQTRTETNFWEQLQETLNGLLGDKEGRSVMVMPQAGLVTVRALPREIREIRTFLQASQRNIQRQVVLEARVLEVSLSDEYQQGINWSQIVENSGSTEFVLSTTGGSFGNGISATLGGVTNLSFLNADFSGVLSLLSTQGNVQVLSSPRVTATNNQKAVIKVGDDEYFVTDVSNQNTITSGTTTVTPNIELTPFFSGIALDVTPQIDDDGSVLLHVHPSVVETEEQEKVITLNEERFVLPLAQSNIRESDTVIRASSGEIVVIGGLMQSIISERHSKTPLLGSIPLLGELFTSRHDVETKKELVILLKPTVVGPDTWKQQLRQSRDKMADWLYVE
ncbi:pilus (MSHA type) biogenesis protein MshL [Aestuariibacter halophilus]|uniref:Pilus (MSHA type) biogenesis protein MshL n=1 Tax=Fluctibacter halophilus TaxID=226011 RepID=A0ABS8GBN4_9ALTE|nr:pilus (MSHA type) biogenesis protein MshL [Aestuariibacter halophilus]MCC2617636.1 pilus (MSHA type) biogenesis protein MshL [Aestuariibacter halophilus]